MKKTSSDKFNEDFWIDDRGEIRPAWRTHAVVVAEQLLPPGDVLGDITEERARELGYEEGTDEWDLLIYGDDEAGYKIAMNEWGWIRAVAAGSRPMVQIGSVDRRTLKRIASGFEKVYGEDAYGAEYYIEVGTDMRPIFRNSPSTFVSDFWSLDAGEVPSARWSGGHADMVREASASRDFWIDDKGKPIMFEGHHATQVRKKILEDAGISWDDRKKLSRQLLEECGIPHMSEEWKALFGDFEDAYAFGIRKWGWIRVVADHTGKVPYSYVRDFERNTMKRIALGFESVYGDGAHGLEYYVEEYSPDLEGRAGWADFWSLDRGEPPSSRRRFGSTWMDRAMVREAFSVSSSDDASTLTSGLDYYAGEYDEALDGTIYKKWADAGEVIPMRWRSTSSKVIDVWVTVYMGMRGESADFLRKLRDDVIRPAGWSIQMTTPESWVEKDGEKFSVVRMELQR